MTFPSPALVPASILCALALFAGTALAADPVDRFWVLMEHGKPCDAPEGPCSDPADFHARMFVPEDAASVTRWISEGEALRDDPVPGSLPSHPDGARICIAAPQPGFAPGHPQDHEAQPLSDPLLALRGLEGLAFDVTGLAAPPGETDDFGRRLQAEAAARLGAAGLRVVRPGDEGAIPGKPKLSIFFSFTDPDGTCDYTYSAFVSLTQTAVLTRNPEVKLTVGTWSASFRPRGEEGETEFGLILEAIDAFIEDYQTANGPG